MTELAIPGVHYIVDIEGEKWIAPGRPELPWHPPVVIDDTIFAGADPLGTTNYAIPADAVFVAKTGSNSNPGTVALPFLTIQAAYNAVDSGTTIVIRAGSYREKVTTTQGKIAALQAYPFEKVWLDGTAVYGTWTNNGDGTWTAPYTVTFARFSTTSYPGADALRNHPDQVWIDDVPLVQVADATTPGVGQFSVNQATDQLTIGSNPAGKTVKVTELDLAIFAPGRLDLYGIGVRRYSPQMVSDQNAMLYYGGTSGGTIFENCFFQESGMAALNFFKPEFTITRCTFQDLGYSGVLGSACDRLVFERNKIQRVNRGLWQGEPATGGMKLTRADTLLIRHNIVTDVPVAYGIWLDVSCTRFIVAQNDVNGTGLQPMKLGIEVEECDGGKYGGVQYASIVAGNKVRNVSAAAIKGLCTGFTRFWNNDVRTNPIGIHLQQDRPQNDGSDPKNRTNAECPWWTVGNEVINNQISSVGGFNIQFLAYDSNPKQLTGGQMFTRLAGNWFNTAPPGSMAQLGLIGGVRNSYNSPQALIDAPTTVGGPFAGRIENNFQGGSAPSNDIADPLPTTLASALGLAPGTQLVGPNLNQLPIPTPEAA